MFPKTMRLLCLIALLITYFLRFRYINKPLLANWLTNLLYITTWSIWFTWTSFGFGTYLYFKKSFKPVIEGDRFDTETETETETSLNLEGDKYMPIVAWKCHIITYELAIIFSLIITPIHWIVYARSHNPQHLSGKLDHLVPLICLLVDQLYN